MQNRNYRECAIEHLKKGNLCKGYIDYILGEMDKLEKIKQIIDSRDGFYLYDNLPPFQQIKEILEKE